MYIKIQISDATYASLLNGTSRIQGSIGLVNPTEGNFNEHQRTRRKADGCYMRLPHGRVTITNKDVRLSLSVLRKETVEVSQVILGESLNACDFVDIMSGELTTDYTD